VSAVVCEPSDAEVRAASIALSLNWFPKSDPNDVLELGVSGILRWEGFRVAAKDALTAAARVKAKANGSG
jgi:hypothetical protein